MRRLLLSLVLLAAPAFAQDCPEPGDLRQGIVVTRASGLTETWRQDPTDPDLIHVIERDGGEEVLRLSLIHGIFIVSEVWSGTNWDPIITTFAATPPLPAAKATVTVMTEVVGTGLATEAEEISVRYGTPEVLALGECRITALRAEVSYPFYVERLLYLPDFRMSLLIYDPVDPWQDSNPVVTMHPSKS